MAEPVRQPGEESPPPRRKRRGATQSPAAAPADAARNYHTLSLEAGDQLQVKRPRRTKYDFEGGKFYQMSLPMSEYLGRLRLTGTEYSLLLVLSGSQEQGTGLITMTQVELAKRVRTGRTDTSRILAKFRKWGLVIKVGNASYRINPRVAFFGTSDQQESVLAELDENLPQLNLPKIPGDG